MSISPSTPITLITGATSGFGEAMALKFGREGHRLILTGRRADRLTQLKDRLKADFEADVHTLAFDVRDRAQCEEAISSLPEHWSTINILINNAGLASGLDHIQDGDPDDWDKMIDTNIKGLLYISRPVIDGMSERRSGHIINIGSTAGKEVYAKGNVYCATKHAVDAITKGMRIDLLDKGIKVTQIAPGAAETEFSLVRFHGNEARAKAAYEGYTPMRAEDIAEVAFYTTTLPAHLCINDIVMTATAQANSHYIDRKS